MWYGTMFYNEHVVHRHSPHTACVFFSYFFFRFLLPILGQNSVCDSQNRKLNSKCYALSSTFIVWTCWIWLAVTGKLSMQALYGTRNMTLDRALCGVGANVIVRHIIIINRKLSFSSLNDECHEWIARLPGRNSASSIDLNAVIGSFKVFVFNIYYRYD